MKGFWRVGVYLAVLAGAALLVATGEVLAAGWGAVLATAVVCCCGACRV